MNLSEVTVFPQLANSFTGNQQQNYLVQIINALGKRPDKNQCIIPDEIVSIPVVGSFSWHGFYPVEW